jgi:hypothetical protein
MDLHLHITKKEKVHYNTRNKIKHLFAVIDLDKSKHYPQNFVSVLPRNIKAIVKPANIFEEIFGNKSLDIAKQLLGQALKSRPNAETTRAIRERLDVLDPKLTLQSKCLKYGEIFEQKKRGYKRYPLCYECYRKRYSKN